MKIGRDTGFGLERDGDGLSAIVETVEVNIETGTIEWSAESARLFALDCALVMMRRLLPWLTDAEATHMGVRLNEARRLAVAGREIELGFVSDELVSMLTASRGRVSRQVWIIALNAMIPDPYRAARIACETAVAVDRETGDIGHPSIESRLRERFAARINEAAMTRPSYVAPTAGLVGA